MKTTAIYVRRSVSDADKGNNSLSIAAQKEECIRFLGEGVDFRIYCDDERTQGYFSNCAIIINYNQSILPTNL